MPSNFCLVLVLIKHRELSFDFQLQDVSFPSLISCVNIYEGNRNVMVCWFSSTYSLWTWINSNASVYVFKSRICCIRICQSKIRDKGVVAQRKKRAKYWIILKTNRFISVWADRGRTNTCPVYLFHDGEIHVEGWRYRYLNGTSDNRVIRILLNTLTEAPPCGRNVGFLQSERTIFAFAISWFIALVCYIDWGWVMVGEGWNPDEKQ